MKFTAKDFFEAFNFLVDRCAWCNKIMPVLDEKKLVIFIALANKDVKDFMRKFEGLFLPIGFQKSGKILWGSVLAKDDPTKYPGKDDILFVFCSQACSNAARKLFEAEGWIGIH